MDNNIALFSSVTLGIQPGRHQRTMSAPSTVERCNLRSKTSKLRWCQLVEVTPMSSESSISLQVREGKLERRDERGQLTSTSSGAFVGLLWTGEWSLGR